jgi:starch-binding outer membrane protein, SusD/RagB family
MKKITYLSILALILMSMFACKDSFLDSYPGDQTSSQNFYQNEGQFLQAINGVYNSLHEYRQSQDYFPMLEMATPCATMGNYNNARWKDYGWGGNGYTPSSCEMSNNWWKFWWRGIRRACNVLDHVAKEGDVITTAGLKDRIQGEAYFLRAYNYFFLTYFYGDVPYITTLLDSIYPYRAPHSQIVEYMISDLTKAESLLPSVTTYRGTENIGRASKGSAMALLGKVYCYEQRWAEAETELKKLVATDDYKLNDNFVDQFVTQDGENSDESIFEIQYIADQGDDRCSAYATFCGTGAANLSGSGTSGYNYNEPTEYLTDMYQTQNGYDVTSTWTGKAGSKPHDVYTCTSDDPAFDPDDPFANRDPRLMWTVMYEGSPYLASMFPKSNFTADAPPLQNYGTVKYIVLQSSDLNSGQNHITIRYADMLLLLAESLMEQDKGSEAATYVNMVRSRASVAMPDVPDAVVADQSLLREYIHKERIRELAMEFGHVFFDLHRWGTYASEMNTYWTAGKHGNTSATQASYTSKQDLWPIPQAEIDRNSNLSQNPGY